MKKKILIALVAGTMLSGCYTHICPTYTVKPGKKKNLKVQMNQDDQQKEQKRSS